MMNYFIYLLQLYINETCKYLHILLRSGKIQMLPSIRDSQTQTQSIQQPSILINHQLPTPKQLQTLPKIQSSQKILKIFTQQLNSIINSPNNLDQIHQTLEILDILILSCTQTKESSSIIILISQTFISQFNRIIEAISKYAHLSQTKDQEIMQQWKFYQKIFDCILKEYMELVTSYCYYSTNHGGNQYWSIYSIVIFILSTLYDSSILNLSLCLQTSSQFTKISSILQQFSKNCTNLKKINPQKYSTSIIKQLLLNYPEYSHDHEQQPIYTFIGKALRNFIIHKQFLKSDSPMLRVGQLKERVNNCNLLIDLYSAITTAQLGDGSVVKRGKVILQWLSLLKNICEGQAVNHNENSHKFDQYTLQFCKYLHNHEIPELQSQNNPYPQKLCKLIKISISELLSVAFFRNPHSVVTLCRKLKIIDDIIEIWLQGFQFICGCGKKDDDFCEESAKRMILGLIGLMRLDSFETAIETVIENWFPICIKIIESINVQQQDEYIPAEQLPIQTKYNHNKNYQQQIKSDAIQQQIWDQQLEYKFDSEFIQNIDQIQELKSSFRHLCERNSQLFDKLMQTFSAEEIILWTLELEENQDQL